MPLLENVTPCFGLLNAKILLEAFLTSNSVISSFQCEINGSFRIAHDVRAILIGQN